MIISTVYWHTLCPRFIDSESRVLDIGANYGRFAAAMIERFDCNVFCVEPSPTEFKSIQKSNHIDKMNAAVSDSNGTAEFHIAKHSVSSSLHKKHETHQRSIRIATITLESLVESLGWNKVDLLKMDIEGAEIPVLTSASKQFLKDRVRQISVEFHDFNGITPKQDVDQCIRNLTRLGFFHVRMSRVGHQDTWLLNRNLCRISTIELLFAKYVERNWMGFTRVLRRTLFKNN